MSKVTNEQIQGKIRKIEYSRIGSTTTICMMTLENGFQVIGTSACADPATFNAEQGERYAYLDAYDKIWPLEGYLLKEQLYQAEIATQADITMRPVELKPQYVLPSSFEFALNAIKLGYRVFRAGWNGKDQWVALSGSTEPREVAAINIWSPHARQFAEDSGGVAKVAPGLLLKNAQGVLVMGWVPSTGDLLADDWYILSTMSK